MRHQKYEFFTISEMSDQNSLFQRNFFKEKFLKSKTIFLLNN